MTGLAGEVIYEAVKFIIMLLLLAGGSYRRKAPYTFRCKKRGKKQGNLGG